MSVQIDTSDLERIVRQAVSISDQDTHTAYMTIAAAVVEDTKNRFSELPPLAPSTQKRRGPGAKPLQDTMELFNAATALSGGVEFSDFDIGPEGLVIGVDKPGAEEALYGSIHEIQRQFMGTDDDYILRIAEESGAIATLMNKMVGDDY